jgi:hypothetical protein
MNQFPDKKENFSNDPTSLLQQEIAVLETELEKIKKEVVAFESEIHRRFDKEISHIQNLTQIYKRQKAEKKAKRLEQKKRGKNYKEPKQLTIPKSKEKTLSTIGTEEQKELKRLYKEAVVKVHPDKVGPNSEAEKIDKANQITAQLNAIYKSGDLEELINFYQFIILENPSSDQEIIKPEQLVDPKIRLTSLRKKKEALEQHIEQLKGSYIFNILATYENPLDFIEELYVQFQEKIKQMEKRTRKG